MTTQTTSTELSREEQLKLILSQFPELRTKKGGTPRTLKLNKNGDMYLTDPKFQAWSEKKGKFYQAGLNIDIRVAKELFLNDELLKEVKAFLSKVE